MKTGIIADGSLLIGRIILSQPSVASSLKSVVTRLTKHDGLILLLHVLSELGSIAIRYFFPRCCVNRKLNCFIHFFLLLLPLLRRKKNPPHNLIELDLIYLYDGRSPLRVTVVAVDASAGLANMGRKCVNTTSGSGTEKEKEIEDSHRKPENRQQRKKKKERREVEKEKKREMY